MSRMFTALLAGSAMSLVCGVHPAFAQDSSALPSDQNDREIVVTGTLIRGIAPVGTPTIAVTQQDIQEAGGVTVQDVLAKVSQVSFFNIQPSAGTSTGQGMGNKQAPRQPQIHGLPALILLDGHRIASVGTAAASATSFDPSIIPTSVLGGIEIVPDGGSALYGSDAVGGVINMTTMKRFDGVKLDGAIGFANSYREYRGSVTAGKDWGTGSIYASYAYNQSDALFGRDRPFIQQNPAIEACVPSTVAFGTTKFRVTGVDASGKPTYASGASTCDRYPYETVLPAQRMHSVFAGLSQELSSTISVDLRAFYSTRNSTAYNAQAIVGSYAQRTDTPATQSPYYVALPGQATNTNQTTQFTLAPLVGPNLPQTSKLTNWGVTGEFTVALFGDFRARLLGNYNESAYNAVSLTGKNEALFSAAIIGGVINPYDVSYTANSAAAQLAAEQIVNRPTYDFGGIQQTQVRLVSDGTLFAIPGGDVKVAFGGEMVHERYDASSKTRDHAGQPTATPDAGFSGTRTVFSVFGELNVPLISPDSGGPIHELRLSAAGRYDHYSDFGDTFNPRFAASLSPVEWLTFRGTYGTSFVAPSLPQLFAPQTINHTNTPFVISQIPTPPAVTSILIIQGGNPILQPEKATTWSLGMDLRLPFLAGLRASLTYYNADYTNRIAAGPSFIGSALYQDLYKDIFFIQNPTLASAEAFVGGPYNFLGGIANCTSLQAVFDTSHPTCLVNNPTYAASTRAGNIAASKTSGLDFNVDFRHETSFGSIDFGVGGNYILTAEGSQDSLTFTDQLPTQSRFRGTVSAGANVGNFRASARLLHTSGFELTPPFTTSQTRIAAYNTVDAFMSYTFQDDGYFADTVLSLQVSNLFDVRPPVDLTSSTGYRGGSITGRTVQLGVSKKF